ncbi:MAG TPA: FKBP-type peptidyl-prolyl cis-trans isomerase [Candidatus Dormibacteraeota bacterium]|nr:FKBP-type peptidyl-prolyl cis-trans isomerase [Candidatus Dormibacteraeota bacterium]
MAAVVLAAAACGYSDPYASNSPVANESPGQVTPSPGTDDFHAGDGLTPIVFPDGLKIIDLKVGTGTVARTGDDATVQYTGWLADGTVFDSSRSRNQPFTFSIGKGQVIAGWDEGVPGMAAGGQRKLIIPAALAYGTQGQTDPNTGASIIPPNATLVFEVELVSVKAGPSPSPSQ